MLNLHRDIFKGAEIPQVFVSESLVGFFNQREVGYLAASVGNSLNYIYSIEGETYEATISIFRSMILDHWHQGMFQNMPSTQLHYGLREEIMRELDATFTITVREHDGFVVFDKLERSVNTTQVFPYFYGSLFPQREH